MSTFSGSSHFLNGEDSLDLRGQIEELKGLLRANQLNLKDKELKFSKTAENYEMQIQRLNDENKQMKEKYEKIVEAQRKLEKLNSGLEDKLLKIVEKYENEQKNLFEELTLAHSRLIETKLQMSELEKEREFYRQDCNLAVNLLQCNASEFVNHSYHSLPLNLKERLKSYLTIEEIAKLEEESDETNNQYSKISSENLTNHANANKLLKIPVFQPSAAMAMMYMNTSSLQQQHHQRELKTKQKKQDEEDLSATILNMETNNNSKLITRSGVNNGKVSSGLIAQLLKKDSDNKSDKSFKLFPYICLRCKKEAVICDSPSQTNLSDLQDSNLRTLIGNPKNIFGSSSSLNEYQQTLMLRSKTVANNLSEMKTITKSNNYHHKCASTDLGNFNRSKLMNDVIYNDNIAEIQLNNSKSNPSSKSNLDIKTATTSQNNNSKNNRFMDLWSDVQIH